MTRVGATQVSCGINLFMQRLAQQAHPLHNRTSGVDQTALIDEVVA